MNLLLKGGRVIDPFSGLDKIENLLVSDGRIKGRIDDLRSMKGPHGRKSYTDLKVIDLSGKIVVPGLTDMHTHLREPGHEYKETIYSGSEAAAAGGFTSIACMPNTNPINDNRSVTEFIIKKAAAAGIVNVYPIAAISLKSEGVTLSDYWDLKEGGAVGFSDDGKPVMNAGLMRRALEYASSLKMPIISHCEDTNLSAGGVMHEGLVSAEIGLAGIPAIAEDAMVSRDILIAEFTKAHLHIAHVSTAGAVRLIREAKARGVNVTAETAPHYFMLTDEAVRTFNTFAKVYPPLRGAKDREAVREGLSDGTIDAIASDHAPHARTDKEVEFDYASTGIVGLETSLSLSLSLVHDGVLPLPKLIEKMSLNPARIIGIPKGTLADGADADITVIDQDKEWVVDPQTFRSRGKNTPFKNWRLKGKAVLTIVAGEIRYQDL